MGEIADMMLDGTLCEGCGEYMGSSRGFPRLCPSCRRASATIGTPYFPAPRNPAKVACEVCGRHVKRVGLEQHKRDTHGSSGSA
jgi:hypothetical protein